MISRILINSALARSSQRVVLRQLQRRQVHNLDPIKQRVGWTFESPNLAQFQAMIGAIGSIGLRAVVVWNAVMLIFEAVAYPNDLVSLITLEKNQ